MIGNRTLTEQWQSVAMTEDYSPSSVFLTWVISGDAPLIGTVYAEANLRKVIALTSDEDKSNRDWAAFLLGTLDLDTPAIRAALVACADDDDEDVRAEAIQGLARRDVSLALPFIEKALSAPSARIGIFEAAAAVAHPSLIKYLRAFALRNADDELIADALAACEAGIPDVRYQ
jgi:HEAT repeat protein